MQPTVESHRDKYKKNIYLLYESRCGWVVVEKTETKVITHCQPDRIVVPAATRQRPARRQLYCTRDANVFFATLQMVEVKPENELQISRWKSLFWNCVIVCLDIISLPAFLSVHNFACLLWGNSHLVRHHTQAT